MRQIILSLIFLYSSLHCLSQKDPSVLIGNIYRNYGAELHPENEKRVNYRLFTQYQVLSISTKHSKGSLYRGEIDSVSTIYIDSIRPLEEYWGGWTDIYEDGFYYSGSDVWPYNRVESMPYLVWHKIYVSGELDERDYIQEFLNIIVKSICVDQLDVYDGVDGSKVGYLVQDDLVEILDEQGDWVKVHYLKTDAEYWTYMSCLE